jgi:hypothetical protein
MSEMDERDELAKKLSCEIVEKILDKYGSPEQIDGFPYVAIMIATDLIGFVLFDTLSRDGWDEFCKLITEESKRRAQTAKNFVTGSLQ